MIYKTGSKGESVKLIQLALIGAGLNVTADGAYGPRTADAVRMFQRQNKLDDDGIAGRDTIMKLFRVNITAGYITQHITHSPSRNISYIAIHYTAGASSAKGCAMKTKQVFLSRPASADFVVDDNEIVQVNPDIRNYYCWAVGDKLNTSGGGGQLYNKAYNKNTVSIEICSNLIKGASAAMPNHFGWFFTDAEMENAIRLVRYLMVMYDIPQDRVVRHYDITGKCCPGIPGWNNASVYSISGKYIGARSNSNKWQEFKQRIWKI